MWQRMYTRIDVVFDVYSERSIKAQKRIRRGAQQMCSISIIHDNVPVPKNWSAFLTNIHNKNELVDYIVKVWSRLIEKISAVTIVTN